MEEAIGKLIADVRTDINRTTPRQRFKFPLDRATTEVLLTESFEAQVKARRMEFKNDGNVKYYVSVFTEWLVNSDDKCSIMLCGGCGTGKTTLAVAFARLANSLQQKAEKTERFWLYQQTQEVQAMYDAMSRFPTVRLYTAQDIADAARRSKEDKTDEYLAIKRTPFLIIDDLGCEPTEVKNFGTSITPITDIIYERYSTMRPTIITTNLDPSQIRTEYNPRVADRLNEICRVIGYKNNSYRK